MSKFEPDRREFLKLAGKGMASLPFVLLLGCSESQPGGEQKSTGKGTEKVRTEKDVIRSQIPGTGEKISPIGLGTWRTFNVGSAKKLMNERTEILAQFFRDGGGMIDSSPMYGSAEKCIGYGLSKLRNRENGPDLSTLFSATKVWTPAGQSGSEQIQNSKQLWNVKTFDLLQVHNLVDWKTHLPTLLDKKENGEIRYVGITTSHGRRHGEMKQVMRSEPIDFVQLTYNLRNRDVEDDLLPVAREQNLGVIVNRPFAGGSLVKGLQREDVPLPDWSSEIDCLNWPQFLLKFIISHPAVTCAIPATSKVVHLKENKGAARGRLPDEDRRQRMIEYVEEHT